MKLRQIYQSIHHPEQYHGEILKPPFFEGWYFKVVTADRSRAFAFIPGISFSKTGKQDHAFVQILDGNTGKVHVKEVPVDAFYWAPDAFDLYLGENHFNDHQMQLDLILPEICVQGHLWFDTPTPWPKTFLSPGIMGPFGWLPFLECMHGILSFDHAIQGELRVDGETIDFSGGRGYIEKDWGKSFPSDWIWMQSNHFASPHTSFTFSLATIPFGLFHFTGVIAGLWKDGVLYPFTTYGGVSTEVKLREKDQAEIVLQQGKMRLWVHAERITSGSLKAPTLQGMNRRIMESLDAKIHLKLWIDDELAFDEMGERGGLEIVN